MSQISIEFQKTIQDKIDAAWKAKKEGDCFMQKNDFAEIIVVHKNDLDKMWWEGWRFFILACYKNVYYATIRENELKAAQEKALEKAQAKMQEKAQEILEIVFTESV